jgi:hypothetical protein
MQYFFLFPLLQRLLQMFSTCCRKKKRQPKGGKYMGKVWVETNLRLGLLGNAVGYVSTNYATKIVRLNIKRRRKNSYE